MYLDPLVCFEEGRRVMIGLKDEVGTVEGAPVDIAVDTAVGIAGIAGTAGAPGSSGEWW